MSSFEPTCEATCDCVRNKFSPICGADGKTYFSACHAGCSNYTIVDGKVASVSTTDIDRYLGIFSGYPLRGGKKKKKKRTLFDILLAIWFQQFKTAQNSMRNFIDFIDFIVDLFTTLLRDSNNRFRCFSRVQSSDSADSLTSSRKREYRYI